MMQGNNTTTPQHHNTTTPQHHNTTTPQHHNTTTPQHHNTTTPQHHNTTTPQHHNTTTPQHHNTTTPQISVIFPVRNTKEEYLRESIESILSQTYTDFEFIIINDMSTEEHVTQVIFSYTDPRIIYLYSDYGNLSSALNMGLRHARGKYIARMDSDDIAYPERFEKQIAYLENNPHISLLGTGMETFPEHNILTHRESPSLFYILNCAAFFHPTVMWRREDFERYNFYYDEQYAHSEDYELWSRVIRSLKTHNLQEPLLKYRLHEDSVSIKYRDIQLYNSRRVQQHILDFCTDDDLEQRDILDFFTSNKKKRKLFGMVIHRNHVRFYFLGIRILKIKRR